MAATGINEFYEARRQQHIINKRAYYRRMFLVKPQDNIHGGCPQILSCNLTAEDSLEQNFVQCHQTRPICAKHENASEVHYMGYSSTKGQQNPTYSAKINGRFTSLNYAQQW